MHVSGILHAHSTYSYDGKLTLHELRDLSLSRGVSFVCMTEHTDELTKERAEEFVKECAAHSDSTFRFIPGFEVPFAHAHILMIGMRDFYGTYAPSVSDLKQWTDRASFVVLAHPVRNDFEVGKELLERIHALEVWNQQYDGKRVPRTRSLRLFEELKKGKETLLATGGVDFHRTEHFGSPLVTMDVEELTEQHILEKLKSGAYTIESHDARLFGTLPDAHRLMEKHRVESAYSVGVIVLGKFVNKTLARVGLRLPKSLKERVRKTL